MGVDAQLIGAPRAGTMALRAFHQSEGLMKITTIFLTATIAALAFSAAGSLNGARIADQDATMILTPWRPR